MLILGMNLIVQTLMTSPTEIDAHELANRSRTGTLAMWRSLILPMTSSTSSSSWQVTGFAGHHVGDAQPAKAFAPAVNHAQDVSFAEDPDQTCPPWSTTGREPMLFCTSLAMASLTVASESMAMTRRPLASRTSRTSMRLLPDTEHASAANDSRVHRPTLSTWRKTEV